MATREQLDEHAEETRDNALHHASAQLAVIVTEEALRSDPVDISQRRDFASEAPQNALNADETAQLGGAELVIGALKVYVEMSVGLQNKQAPRMTSGHPNGYL